MLYEPLLLSYSLLTTTCPASVASACPTFTACSKTSPATTNGCEFKRTAANPSLSLIRYASALSLSGFILLMGMCVLSVSCRTHFEVLTGHLPWYVLASSVLYSLAGVWS